MSTPKESAPASSSVCLRQQSLAILQLDSAQAKAQALLELDPKSHPLECDREIIHTGELPGRPLRPVLVQPGALTHRAVGTIEGRASLIHALTHIEANAINLALDIVWRFDGLPEEFYRDWLTVAQEEAHHYQLLASHLQGLGHQYGDFPAHDGLWDMAQRTRGDVLARLALVPRTLEARGLDATPAIRKKLVSVGDLRGAQILDIILRDEIGHVATGNHWYRQVCQQRGLDPLATSSRLARQYAAPALKGPFNWVARKAAGFADEELAALGVAPAQKSTNTLLDTQKAHDTPAE